MSEAGRSMSEEMSREDLEGLILQAGKQAMDAAGKNAGKTHALDLPLDPGDEDQDMSDERIRKMLEHF